MSTIRRKLSSIAAVIVLVIFTASVLRSVPTASGLWSGFPVRLPAPQGAFPCLPTDIPGDSLVKIGDTATEKLTTRLRHLHARCRGGKLIDRHRREIRLYQLQGCWGNPPVNYGEILENQRLAIAALRKKYTVLEIPCDQGMPIQ